MNVRISASIFSIQNNNFHPLTLMNSFAVCKIKRFFIQCLKLLQIHLVRVCAFIKIDYKKRGSTLERFGKIRIISKSFQKQTFESKSNLKLIASQSILHAVATHSKLFAVWSVERAQNIDVMARPFEKKDLDSIKNKC